MKWPKDWRCRNCEWAIVRRFKLSLECRMNPPQIYDTSTNHDTPERNPVAGFPPVDHDWYCSEHVLKDD